MIMFLPRSRNRTCLHVEYRFPKTSQFLLVCLAVFGSLQGCGVDTQSLSEMAGDMMSDSARADDSAQSDTSTVVKTVSFQPKFADRIDPFRYPNETFVTKVEPGFNAERATSVEVLGFAKMDAAKVILRMQETTKSLGIGENLMGIEVVEISPPTVKLRSGSLVWSASMFGSSL